MAQAFDPDQPDPYLRARYGLDAIERSRRRNRFIAWPLGLAALGWLYWSANFAAHPAFATELLGFKVVSNNSIQIDYQVTLRDPAKGGHCTLVARDLNKNLVAQFDDVIAPSNSASPVRHDVTLKTTGAPVNGDVIGCHI